MHADHVGRGGRGSALIQEKEIRKKRIIERDLKLVLLSVGKWGGKRNWGSGAGNDSWGGVKGAVQKKKDLWGLTLGERVG